MLQCNLPKLALLFFAFGAAARPQEQSDYVGRQVCIGCHKDIAATQVQTNMSHTWQSLDTKQLPANFSETFAEGPAPEIQYKASRLDANAINFQVQMPGQPNLTFPVEALVGGPRHALTFLYRVSSIGGIPLPRAPLIEGRYIHSTRENRLGLELGFPEEKPSSYETGLGRVLTPALEKRCFSCHTGPRMRGDVLETSVTCENCHGPGRPHLVALGKHSPDLAILNPKKLPVAEKMRTCTQCHAGSGVVEDPLPDNLLISDQVTGLKNSECWRVSQGQITCVNCHNPHQDAPQAVLEARSVKTCLGCHNAAVPKHAALCPVNRTDQCVGCHLPKRIRGVFHLADHWIRVHPEQNVTVPALRKAEWKTQVVPNHLYLKFIVLDDAAKASQIHSQLAAGGSFFDLARANSLDHDTAINGGFAGDLPSKDLNPDWARAALKLAPGEVSPVVPANGKFYILQRLPRNFRQEADAHYTQALELRKQGKIQESIAECLNSLRVYPRFLRALAYLGMTYSQGGNPQTGAGILSLATRYYPGDQGAHFNLGVAYGGSGNDAEIDEYKRTIEIDQDYIPAYLNWGGALYSKGRYDEAIELYRKAILINPLSADLHYNLSLALEHQGQLAEAKSEMDLAAKIDPKFATTNHAPGGRPSGRAKL